MTPRPSTVRAATVAVAVLAAATWSAHAEAAPPSPELMAKLAESAARFEALALHGRYSFAGHMETVDGDGRADDVKEMRAHVEPSGELPRMIIDRYLEDGEDKTEEARADAVKREEKRRRDPERHKKRLRMPTLASEQGRYDFDVVETDPRDPSRVKLAFNPRAPDEHTLEGTAWVDGQKGTVLSAGFKLSRTSLFVRYVHVTVVFGADTAFGPAISRIDFEGEGGILFVRKHFRGSATLSDYRAP